MRVIYMSIATGFQTIRILLNNIPNTQPSGTWVGNATPITYLDRGVYFVNYNVSYECAGPGPITNSQTAICIDAPFIGAGKIIATTPITGPMGLSGTNSMRMTLSNTAVITTDNTPIYMYLSCTITGPWGTINPQDSNLNILSFTKLSSL